MYSATILDLDHEQEHASCGTAHQPHRGVLLINLGTPEAATAASVREYLREFLADPAVIQLPRFLRWLNVPLGRMIARFRCKASASMYQSIWSDEGSPLLATSNEQVSALQKLMPRSWGVYAAMRYGKPSIPEVLKQIEKDGIEELVIVPMYPQYSGPTTGTAIKVVYDYLRHDDHLLQVTTRLSWYNDHSYVSAQAKLLQQYTNTHGLTPDNTYLLFSAHGLPVSYVRKGDPYPSQIAETVSLVTDKSGWPRDRMSMAFQSRFGPAKWLEPYTDYVLKDLVAAGEKRILVCPISFTVDCLETLEEIDVRYREFVEGLGAELFLMPALNTFQPFISSLKHLVLQGCSPVNGRKALAGSLDHSGGNAVGQSLRTDSLIMVGASIPGRINIGKGPHLHYTDSATLKRIKRPTCAVPDFLKSVIKDAGLIEAFVWNTCHRFELYGWVSGDRGDIEAETFEKAASIIRRQMVSDDIVTSEDINVLVGVDAHHHMLRTASGLNSSLPGERDILTQLHAAQRLAEQAETAGPITGALLHQVANSDITLRKQTAWGSYSPGYAQIALQYVADRMKFDWLNCRVAVIGGSTTSAGVLRALTDQFGLPSKQITLVHRGHKNGNHLKVLRKAIGQGKRIRVQNYNEAVVDRLISDVDIVIFGLDSETPLIDEARFKRVRGASSKALTIVDFNTFGSTAGLATLPNVALLAMDEIEKAVNANATALSTDETFLAACSAAEDWIADSVAGDTVNRIARTVKHKLDYHENKHSPVSSGGIES